MANDSGKGLLVVTGGSRGIGAAIARDAARAGYRVLLTYAGRADLADQVVATIASEGGQAEAVRCDTGLPRDIAALFAAVDQRGPLEALVYNGGIVGPSSPLIEASDELLDKVIAVNLTGALLCSREAVRRMSTASGGAGGSIVLISSRAALYGAPGEHVWYAASKGGVDSLTMGLAREVAPQGIRVNAVSPGPIDTEIHVPGKLARIASALPMQRVGQPAEVSAAVMFLLSPSASYVAGANIAVAGAR
jgi:NAD(P)-dependent dehydrogenase (short-subunit alcohol dehydrogenase family)